MALIQKILNFLKRKNISFTIIYKKNLRIQKLNPLILVAFLVLFSGLFFLTTNKIIKKNSEYSNNLKEISKNNGAEVHAVVFDKSVADKLSGYQLNSVIYVNNEELNNYNPEYYLKALEMLNNDLNPNLLIFGHSYETRDWVPRLSARLDKAFDKFIITLSAPLNSLE